MGSALVYDAIVVGGGPAGLAAALQLARFNRHVLVFDSGGGRSAFHQVNHNYLGFPGGISARDLRDLARKQVRMYPVAFADERVTQLREEGDRFCVRSESGREMRTRTVVLATGVRDHFPKFPGWESYVGRSIFWCIVCDGYGTRGKRLVLAGNDDEAAVTALQFLTFTNRVTLVTNAGVCGISPELMARLPEHGVRLVEGEISSILGDDGVLGVVMLQDGQQIEADLLFSLQGSSPNSGLAQELGVETSSGGYVVTDKEQQTNIAGFFACGDVTRDLAHQVATAVHEGITAASSAQHHLYAPWQRHGD